MDKKQLKQITTKIYEEYGFVKKDKLYYLDLDEVLICSGFNTMHNVTYLAYNFSVKEVHSDDEREPNNMFDGYDSFEQLIYFNPKAEGYHKKEISYEDWTEDYYSKKLIKLLHYYFDPFKKDAIKHIKKAYLKLGYVHKGEIIALSKEVKKYLELE